MKEMKEMRKNQKGFTLVELVVVIAVLGILAAIAIPNLIGFQDRAKQQADKQVAAQVKTTMALLFANKEVNIEPTTNQVSFGIVASSGTVTISDYPASNGLKKLKSDGSGALVDLTAGDLKTLLEEMISDINLQSKDTKIKVTITSQGSITTSLVKQ